MKTRITHPVFHLRLFAFIASFLIVIVTVSRALAGSPFYITVERSFAHTEAPQIRLDYTATDKPMEVRVLKPENLERFLEGQLQVSRSYELPLAELNPGHYFANGLNRVDSPLRGVRDLLSKDFRASFHDTSFHKAILETFPGRIASAPEEITVTLPAGFSLVHEYYVDLQIPDQTAQDLGWWFAGVAWQEEKYKIRTITLDPLADGVYLVQALQGKIEAQCLLQVSSLSVQVKETSEDLLVRVISRDAAPVAGALVSYRDSRGRWIDFATKTNAAGEAALHAGERLDGRLLVRAVTVDGRQALCDTDFLPAVTKDDAVLVVTDRPIFKPGEHFFFKGIVRTNESGALRIPEARSGNAAISLIRADGTATGLTANSEVTDFGSFSGGFDLDEAQPPGLYRLVAEIDAKPYGGEFRVRDYVKPAFYLELMSRSPFVVPGEEFNVRFRAKRYAGGVPRDTKFEVFLYRKKFSAPQWVAEAGAGLTAGSDYYGKVRSTSALTEPRRIYSSIEERLASLAVSGTPNNWDSAPKLAENGEASFTFTIPKGANEREEEWIYTLMVRARESGWSLAVLTENIFVTLAEAQTMVRFNETVTSKGAEGLKVEVRSTYPDGTAAAEGAGVVDITLERPLAGATSLVKLPFVTDAKGVWEGTIPKLAEQGRLTAIATLEALAGKPMRQNARSEPAWILVAGADGAMVVDNRELELYSETTILSPGEKGRVFALLPANWGKGETGILWETIAGEKIFATQQTAAEGRSRWFEVEARPEYGTGFYHTVTVPAGGGKYREKTLGFRIVPRDKRLAIVISPEREETVPLKPFSIGLAVTRADGTPAADTELSVGIVDRAVYDVQQEMRPAIFDFFYPLPRLNLATFYSDELKGYGYADLLKKPNFRLGALKSQSKPTKKAMRDTAGWFPHVKTDAAGRAMVTADMPANLTDWLVTAIAADKEGRMGEAQGRFKTTTDLGVEAFAPQFLRKGEEVTLAVGIENHLDQEVAIHSQILVSGPATIKEGESVRDLTLAAKGGLREPITLIAQGPEGAATLSVSLTSNENVRVGGTEEFEIALKPATIRQTMVGTRQGSDRFTAAIPKEAEDAVVNVQVFTGLLGAALQSATVLVSYPYGCTEQLVHSTIPNLVLMDLVKKAGLTPETLGPLAGPLTKAERNAGLGIKKIIANQKTNGGFGLFPGDQEPSLGITLIALKALEFASALNMEGASEAFYRGKSWLHAASLDAHPLLRAYELASLAEIRRYSPNPPDMEGYAHKVWANEKASLFDLVAVLRIFAVFKEDRWGRFHEAFKGTTAREELIGRLQQRLKELTLTNGADLGLAAGPPDSLGFGFGSASLVAAALGVLDELNALPAELEQKLKTLLLGSMKNGYWTSTFDTAQVIFHARKILSREAEELARTSARGPRGIRAFHQDGTPLGSLTPIPAGAVGMFKIAGKALGLGEIRLEGLGPEDFPYVALTVAMPFSVAKSQAQGVIVARRLLSLTPRGAEPLDLSRPLKKGDIVVSEVKVQRSDRQGAIAQPSHFLVVEDPVPSFSQPIDNDESYLADAKIKVQDDSYRAALKETRRYPDRTVRVAKVLPHGELILYQVWQVMFPGRAFIPPASAFDMYDESLRGNGEALETRAE